MNAMEACAALVLGKKVRDKDWDEGLYCYFKDGNLLSQDDKGDIIEIANNNSYELYEEDEE